MYSGFGLVSKQSNPLSKWSNANIVAIIISERILQAVTTLSTLSERDSATNVVVFIADSLRFDYLPDRVSNQGLTARTIAPSTYTATSLPSMMTGQYPATHRVWNFNNVLRNPPEIFTYPNSGMDLRNVWVDIDNPAQKPPNRVLQLKDQVTIDKVDEPFTVVIHDKGAHAPYDFFNVEWDSSPPYFKEYAGEDQFLRNEYEKGAKSAADRFFDVVDDLKEREVLEETLVIFTSDHGELLGEHSRGGLYAHGSPVCPELVEVPTVFLGCGLPKGETYDRLVSGTDLAPTILGAQKRNIPKGVEGINLWSTEPPKDRIVRSDFWANAGRVKYGASSAWDKNGGLVQHHGSPQERLLFAVHRKLYKGFQAPANRRVSPRALWQFALTFGKKKLVYGAPDVERTKSAIVSSFEPGNDETDVDPVPEDQLRALGYLE